MAESSLQERLRDHSKAFDGLLSLIPAKMYYGEDNSDQWKKKKQTKEEAAAARRGKLDPDSELNRNAKEVMDERARNKRKARELEEEDDEEELEDDNDDANEDDESLQGASDVEVELPGQGLKKPSDQPNKKQKLQDGEAETATLSKKEQKRLAKLEKKKEKKMEKKLTKPEKPLEPAAATPTGTSNSAPKAQKKAAKEKKKSDAPSKTAEATQSDDYPQQREAKVEEDTKEATAHVDFSGLKDDEDASPESAPQSPIFDTNHPAVAGSSANVEAASTTTSVSSTIPPSEKPKHIKLPADTSLLKERLAAKIEALRAARKADGTNGKPIRTRQELIESRRTKEAERKANKKELRRLAKLEEERKREEALASNSPGLMSPAVELDDPAGAAAANFSFGRVAFGDGAQLSHDLNYVLSQKKKGPSDVKTALLKAQNAKKRLEALDDTKREDIESKDAWLNARRRAEGEKIRDDESILKKAVKRKEQLKKKSEKAWSDRTKGVQYAQKERQKKREENLKKRREEKGAGKKGKKKGAKTKKKARPGFEGSLGVSRRK